MGRRCLLQSRQWEREDGSETEDGECFKELGLGYIESGLNRWLGLMSWHSKLVQNKWAAAVNFRTISCGRNLDKIDDIIK